MSKKKNAVKSGYFKFLYSFKNAPKVQVSSVFTDYIQKYTVSIIYIQKYTANVTNRRGDLFLLGPGEGERLLMGDAGLRRGGGVSPRRTGEESVRLRIGGDSGRRLGDDSGLRLGESGPLRIGGGDRLRGGESGFLRGEADNVKTKNKNRNQTLLEECIVHKHERTRQQAEKKGKFQRNT